MLAAAESRLHALYDADAAAGNHRRMRADILRMRALGAALLGLTAERDRSRPTAPAPARPTVADQLAATLRASGAEPEHAPRRAGPGLAVGPGDRLDPHHGDRSGDPGRHRKARSLTADTEAANASAEERASAARTARRQVEVLEAEMVNRMRPASDPATRAATPPPSVTTSPPSRPASRPPTRPRPRTRRPPRWGRRWPDSRTPVATPTTSPGKRPLAARLPSTHSDTGEQLLEDLGALADALRKEYKALDESLGELADAVAAAANGEAELAASLAELRAGGADDPEPIDHAPMRCGRCSTRRPAPATSCSTRPPGFRGSAREPVLDALVDLGRQRPIVVVDITDDLGAWALRPRIQALRRWFRG